MQSAAARLPHRHPQAPEGVQKPLLGTRAKPPGQSAPYQVHPVGLPEHAEVVELLEHALEVDDDDGRQDGLGEKSLQP